MSLLYDHESSLIDTEIFGDGRTLLTIEMPLRELMRGFFAKLKNIYIVDKYMYVPLNRKNLVSWISCLVLTQSQYHL